MEKWPVKTKTVVVTVAVAVAVLVLVLPDANKTRKHSIAVNRNVCETWRLKA